MSMCVGIQLWKPRENGLQSPHFGEIILTETADHSSHRSRWCHSGKADNRERAEKGEEEDLEERQHLKDWKRKGVFQKDWKEGKDAGGKQEPRENRTLRRRKCVVSGEITMMLFCTPHGTEIWLLFSFWALSLFTPVYSQWECSDSAPQESSPGPSSHLLPWGSRALLPSWPSPSANSSSATWKGTGPGYPRMLLALPKSPGFSLFPSQPHLPNIQARVHRPGLVLIAAPTPTAPSSEWWLSADPWVLLLSPRDELIP